MNPPRGIQKGILGEISEGIEKENPKGIPRATSANS